ncbi:DNA/RNA polymerase superfamily protein [Gossypium australe]|uniref:DNA/RNA polymerase superfamily protein n=1 Tax=Gossypium australe TaxID=47621 RepID=A0A5B6VMP8_9ROSI|nr:DNA/RNA polymerase superfamily protein [Gossypium australe]
MIRDWLKAASDRHKSYANLKRKDIEYSVSEKVFLKVSLWKNVLQFKKKGKLSPRFIGPYRSDPSHVITPEVIEIQPDLTYEEELIQTLSQEVKELRNTRVLLVKALRRHHNTEKATWETKETMRQQHPQFFTPGKISRTKFLLRGGEL